MIEKILLGITLAAPIGPVSLEMIKRGLSKGFKAALVVRLGGALGNTLCLLGAYFGLAHILNTEFKLAISGMIGALVLVYMGVKTLLDNREFVFETNLMSSSLTNGVITGFFLSIANPIGLLFWVSIFAASFETGPQIVSLSGLAANTGIILGVIIWGIILSGLLEVAKNYINQQMIKAITSAAGLLLIYFGIKYAYKAYLLI